MEPPRYHYCRRYHHPHHHHCNFKEVMYSRTQLVLGGTSVLNIPIYSIRVRRCGAADQYRSDVKDTFYGFNQCRAGMLKTIVFFVLNP